MMNGPLPDIRAVIGADVPLHRVTKHELAGACPFCGAGTNRFRVNTQSQRWWCRQCSPSEHWSDAYEYVQRKSNITFPEAKAKLDGVALPPPPALKPPPPGAGAAHGPIIKTYDYVDEAGILLFQVCRHEPKTFSQRRPATDKDKQRAKVDKEFFVTHDADGSAWVGNLDGVYPALYRLPDLLERPQATVFLPEGEKDADTVAELGLLATTNAGGAGNWQPEHAKQLRGRHVVILPDKDATGEKRTEKLTASLKDVAASVVVVNLPGDGKDVTDWRDAGGTAEQLKELVKAARKPARNPRIMTVRELMTKKFPIPISPVPGIIQVGCTLATGKPKSGKSWLLLHLGIAVAYGGFAIGKLQTDGGDVLYLCLEDGEELLQLRLEKLLRGEEWPERLEVACSWPRLDEGGLEEMEEWIKDHPKARMIVVDTLQRIRGEEDPKATQYKQDYNAISPLTDLSHKYNVAIVVVHHTRKSEAADVMDTISGTLGLTGAVDAMLVLVRQRYGTEATLSVTGRRIIEHEMGLLWDEELAQWRHAGSADEMRSSQTQQAIIQTLTESDELLTPKDIADRSGLDYKVITQRLWHMKKANLISSPSYGKYMAVPDRNTRNSRNSTPESRADSRKTPRKTRNSEPPEEGTLTTVTDDYYDDLPPIGAVYQSKPDDTLTTVTSITTAFKCAACGHGFKTPASWDPTQSVCKKCGVSENPIPF